MSLPTQDVLVQNLSKQCQELVHKAIREQLLPFARRQYPHLNAAFDKQPYPRPGNLFIVRASPTLLLAHARRAHCSATRPVSHTLLAYATSVGLLFRCDLPPIGRCATRQRVRARAAVVSRCTRTRPPSPSTCASRHKVHAFALPLRPSHSTQAAVGLPARIADPCTHGRPLCASSYSGVPWCHCDATAAYRCAPQTALRAAVLTSQLPRGT